MNVKLQIEGHYTKMMLKLVLKIKDQYLFLISGKVGHDQVQIFLKDNMLF